MHNNNLKIKLVQNQEDLTKAYIVRAIVYMHEQNCPFEEEFDLNDFTCTQVIGLINNEPVLTARIRYFSDFVKFERLAVRPQYRGQNLGHELLKFMLEFTMTKGFKKFYLHAQSRLENFYNQYGFIKTGENFEFSEHDYLEMFLDLDLVSVIYSLNINNIDLNCNPMIINRPEGSWENSGPLENHLTHQKKDQLELSLEVV